MLALFCSSEARRHHALTSAAAAAEGVAVPAVRRLQEAQGDRGGRIAGTAPCWSLFGSSVSVCLSAIALSLFCSGAPMLSSARPPPQAEKAAPLDPCYCPAFRLQLRAQLIRPRRVRRTVGSRSSASAWTGRCSTGMVCNFACSCTVLLLHTY